MRVTEFRKQGRGRKENRSFIFNAQLSVTVVIIGAEQSVVPPAQPFRKTVTSTN